MTAITREFRLYTNAGLSIPPVIHVNQYDQGETWNFKLYQPNGQQFIPTDAAIVGVKADGNLIANAGTVSDGVVVITETEQMTAAPGKAVFEILFDGDTHGTANFVVLVEASPTNDGVASESDLSLFQEAIDSTSPAAIAQGVSDWMSEHLTPTTPVVDDTLTVQGAAADAKKTGDEITDLKSAIQSLSSIPYAVKQAMDTLFQNVAFKDDNEYRDELDIFHAWATSVNLVSISAVYTPSKTLTDTDSLSDIRSDLVVTANYDNGTTETVTDYTLSGDMSIGQHTITVTYEEKTTSFVIEVVDDAPSDYTWVYKASAGQLLSARTDLVTVAANTAVETLSNGNLNIEAPIANESKTLACNLVSSTNTSAKLKAKIRINKLATANTTQPPAAQAAYGFRLQLSNGTNGIMFYENYYNGVLRLVTYAGNTFTPITTLNFDTWYVIEVERTSNSYKVYLNGEVVYSSATAATYYCTLNRIAVQNAGKDLATGTDTDIDIHWIAYKNNG